MEQELEIIAFGAIPFVIDREKQEFRQFNRPDNIIRFNELTEKDGYYSARFNTNAGYLSTARLVTDTQDDHLLEVFLPAPILHSPESMTDDFKHDLNTSSKIEEWGFYLSGRDTALRLSGMLPHIDLAGTDFTIDWRLKELRETEFPWKNISLRNMEMSDSGEEYLCFYNTETHELFEPDESLFELPEHIVVLEIPNEIKLDPVAAAREYGIGETDLLTDHPIQMTSAAKVTLLSESGLPEFIANNIKKQSDQQNHEERSHKRGR
jgi:hypothetical protein